jgi:hypothetical protein
MGATMESQAQSLRHDTPWKDRRGKRSPPGQSCANFLSFSCKSAQCDPRADAAPCPVGGPASFAVTSCSSAATSVATNNLAGMSCLSFSLHPSNRTGVDR